MSAAAKPTDEELTEMVRAFSRSHMANDAREYADRLIDIARAEPDTSRFGVRYELSGGATAFVAATKRLDADDLEEIIDVLSIYRRALVHRRATKLKGGA